MRQGRIHLCKQPLEQPGILALEIRAVDQRIKAQPDLPAGLLQFQHGPQALAHARRAVFERAGDHGRGKAEGDDHIGQRFAF